MTVFKCKICGGSLEINSNQTTAIWKDCWTKQAVSQSKPFQEDETQLIDRAFILIETGDRKKASICIENVLDFNAKSSDAYLAKCLLDLKYETKEEFEKSVAKLDENKNFMLAYRFANPAQKEYLQRVIKLNEENIKAKKIKLKKRNKKLALFFAALCLVIAIGISGFLRHKNVISSIIK